MPGNDPLAALDVIEQRCRELTSAGCHHEPTTATTDPMTAPQQRAARVEAAPTESRDDNDSHVVQVGLNEI